MTVVICFMLYAGKWDDMEAYVNMIPRDTYDSSFYRSVIAIHADEFPSAQEVIHSRYLVLHYCQQFYYHLYNPHFEE